MVDVLRVAGRARVLAELLMSVQEQEYRVRLLREANDASEQDLVPGEQFTYEARLADLEKAQARLIGAASEDVVREVRRLANG